MDILFFQINRKKVFTVTLIVVIGLFLFLASAVIYLNNLLASPVAPEEGQNIVLKIPSNASADKIANILHQRGLIKSPKVFNVYARYSGADNELKAGEYTFNTSQTLPEIVNRLIKGPPNEYVVTIPEGYTVRQVADLLVSKGLVDSINFYRTVSEEDFYHPFLNELAPGERRLEGYLFPDTYYLGKNSDSKVIIDMMLNRFNEIIDDLDYLPKIQEMGLTLHEAVTIASMIEREAKYDNERPIIAGVIFNRLNKGMPLQIDATVQYVLGTNRSKLYYKDLEIDSPYNTYQVDGLPPGPIASPGRASLLAVVNPEKNDYLYYCAKPDGTHAFSKTLAEHNINKSKYIR